MVFSRGICDFIEKVIDAFRSDHELSEYWLSFEHALHGPHTDEVWNALRTYLKKCRRKKYCKQNLIRYRHFIYKSRPDILDKPHDLMDMFWEYLVWKDLVGPLSLEQNITLDMLINKRTKAAVYERRALMKLFRCMYGNNCMHCGGCIDCNPGIYGPDARADSA